MPATHSPNALAMETLSRMAMRGKTMIPEPRREAISGKATVRLPSTVENGGRLNGGNPDPTSPVAVHNTIPSNHTNKCLLGILFSTFTIFILRSYSSCGFIRIYSISNLRLLHVPTLSWSAASPSSFFYFLMYQ